VLTGKPQETQKTQKNMFSVKFCPKCGSTDVFWAQGLPQLWSLWQCKNCGYQGAFILEDGNLATKLQEEWKKGLRTERVARSIKVGF
jgi:DNA-directed RNA polymerase subunit M